METQDAVVPSPQTLETVPPARSWRNLFGLRVVAIALALLVVGMLALMFWWSTEPARFSVKAAAEARAKAAGQQVVPGYTSVATSIRIAETLLDKRGGYLSNDIAPPGVLMDNIPEWEFGVLQQLRDFTLALRNDFSRSQSQSEDDVDLREAQPLFAYSNDHWILPSTESQYRKGIEHLDAYLKRLADADQFNAQFYARADNLVAWLSLVEKQMGSLSQRLSMSVGQVRINTDLANDGQATQSTPAPAVVITRTPWMQIDNVFYEARGASWALLHLLRAIERDFEPVLKDKNAAISVKQIIRELEESQAAIYSPIILNGGGYGFFANHSLVMANYISRANAALIDLRKLLERG
ncbi:MAG: DUF2333 family protein [Xanthomonadales bacterium PRO6]|nr:hypothetical protein [Xanthomonadales bacterium]MCE7930937.1 DUF2333 family protein [Xanthomonadales bacterium PRO6]